MTRRLRSRGSKRSIGVLLIPLVVVCLLTLANLLTRRYAAVPTRRYDPEERPRGHEVGTPSSCRTCSAPPFFSFT